MAEKYYGITPYAYSMNIPSSLIDPDGRDVDITNLTDEEHKKALVEFLKTQNGKAFIASYLKMGQSFTKKIGEKNHVYTGKSNGEFANDVLAFGSADDLGRNKDAVVLGRTTTNKPDGNQLDEDGYGGSDNKYEVRKQTVEQIWLKKSEGLDKTISALGHEAFVHAFPDQNRIRELRQELNKGTIQPGTKKYGLKLEAITNSGQVDHRNLSNGKSVAFMNFSLQMDVIKSTTKFIKSYNQDVKENK